MHQQQISSECYKNHSSLRRFQRSIYKIAGGGAEHSELDCWQEKKGWNLYCWSCLPCKTAKKQQNPGERPRNWT
ncbi:unnamed protein product [Caretta caretta]